MIVVRNHLANGGGSPVMSSLACRDSPSWTLMGERSDWKAGFIIGRFLVTPMDAVHSGKKLEIKDGPYHFWH